MPAQVGTRELLRGSVVDVDDAAGRVVETIDEFEQGCLATAGGPDEDDELTRLDDQRDVVNGGARLVTIVEQLGDVFEPDLGRGIRRAAKRLPLVPYGAPPLA